MNQSYKVFFTLIPKTTLYQMQATNCTTGTHIIKSTLHNTSNNTAGPWLHNDNSSGNHYSLSCSFGQNEQERNQSNASHPLAESTGYIKFEGCRYFTLTLL